MVVFVIIMRLRGRMGCGCEYHIAGVVGKSECASTGNMHCPDGVKASCVRLFSLYYLVYGNARESGVVDIEPAHGEVGADLSATYEDARFPDETGTVEPGRI